MQRTLMTQCQWFKSQVKREQKCNETKQKMQQMLIGSLSC